MAGRRSNARRRNLLALAAAAGFHVLLGLGLLSAIRPMPPLEDVQPLIVDLVNVGPPPARAVPPTSAAPAQVAAAAPSPSVVRPRPPAESAPATPGAPAPPTAHEATAPPGFKARGTPTPGGEDLRTAARQGGGCNHAELYRLTKAERDACDDRSGLKARDAPTYAVIDKAKQDFFDGACKLDDEWCLYRTGQGPYPGLLALVKKKKSDW